VRSPHDYNHLVARWRAVARKSGVPLRRLVRANGFDHFYLQTPALVAAGGIYISAGIHGDEPASSAALISWAEKNARRLKQCPLLIFPALNPWGLINNCRTDAAGADLNRLFHRDDQPVLHAVKKVVAPFQFRLALMLHEDYDAEGFYLYEVKRTLPFWGEDLLAAVGRVIAIEPRARIDGRTARAGLIRRRFNRAIFARIGYPEAIWLHEFHAERSLTVETPSEFALEQRVRAHEVVLDECLRRLGFG
jgi:murein peptide amidase A